jgi:hypothetical protein
LLLLVGLAGCEGTGSDTDYLDDPYWNIEEGSADLYTTGMPDPGDNVWNVEHAWEDRAPNGMTYDELYADWLSNIQHNSNGREISYTDGTVVPAPSLECADTALFLRFLFASEYKLPMFVRGWYEGGWNYWGHFGWLSARGNRMVDYSGHPLNAARGSYAPLQNRNRYLPDNLQAYPSQGSTIGEYLDAVLTNKRFGFFYQDLAVMIYSGSIVDDYNTYYIRPDAIRGGDLQMHRYDSTGGIGHTITIQNIERSATGRLLQVDVIQSYMPTLPWIVNGYSELTSYTPDPATNGGLRRWRRPELRSGRWYMAADEEVSQWESDVANNPDTFQALFNMSAEDEVSTMLETIDIRRRALFDNPNSCRRREEREEAFNNLYELYISTPELYQSLGFSSEPTLEQVKLEVDRLHRTVDDFIWARMTYEGSWVCHWNPSDTAVNNDMYRATVAYNRQAIADGGCQAIRMFRAENVTRADGTDGFSDLSAWAGSNDYQWAPYSNDENGALSGVTDDTLTDPGIVDYFCEIFDGLGYWTQP